jgi:siderophore synthetase component/RimJ/RimL family protein N-acetyltransferase
VVHGWVSASRARFWGLVGKSPAEVQAAYEAIAKTAEVFMGAHDGRPAFLVEIYDPAGDVVATHYPIGPGDRGMHLLVGGTEQPLHGFTWEVFRTVMEFLWRDPDVRRVVVEPDVRNTRIHALNRRAGFRYQKLCAFPQKLAHVAVCTRADFARATSAAIARRPLAHLAPGIWERAHRDLVAKALGEWSHERLLVPRATYDPAHANGERRFSLATDTAGVSYEFSARLLPLDHWQIDATSIVRVSDGPRDTPLDLLELALDVAPSLGIAAEVLPTYLEELAGTVWAAAYRQAHERANVHDLVHADFQEIEATMAEGHPCFVANSGRVGFDLHDHAAYTPEADQPVSLVWLAAHESHTHFSGLDEEGRLREGRDAQLAMLRRDGQDASVRQWQRQLVAAGHDPARYLFVPVHPWQWFNRLTVSHAGDVAHGALVCLGRGEPHHRPQQSLRTFFDVEHPERPYVKTALSILNMGFMRGLSADYMRDTPAINAWIDHLLRADPVFVQAGFRILRESASVGYRSPFWSSLLPKTSPLNKMVAALWRESPLPRLRDGQRLMTMAALLHRDREGRAFLPELIRASGLTTSAWLERYFACYLIPLLHAFYRYGLAFMPHGENVILILEENVPVGCFLKDIAEEAALMEADDSCFAGSVPARVGRIRVTVPEPLKLLSIFTDVFDCFFRHLAALLEREAYPCDRFWAQVGTAARRYQNEHQELAPAFARHPLFAPTFALSCLNRLQLRDNRQMVDLADPAGSLQLVGTLANPLAGSMPGRQPPGP